MKTTVVYHSADFDGLFCREIARKFLPGAELIGWDFGDARIEHKRLAGGIVYVMDLPVDRVVGAKFPDDEEKTLNLKGRYFGTEGLVWIDHHASSIASHPSIPGYRIDGVAACRLAWQWFTIADGNTPRVGAEIGIPIRPAGVLPMIQDFKNREVDEPIAVRLAGEYDIFDKRDPDAELFQHGLRSQELTEKDWNDLLTSERDLEMAVEFGAPRESQCRVWRLLQQGGVIKYARDQEYRDIIQQQGFDIQFEGLTFLACNSHELDIRSQLFEAGIKPHHDALMGFTFTGKDWRVSLYGVPGKPEIDLSMIAVKYGGGGHKQACGFRSAKLPFAL